MNFQFPIEVEVMEAEPLPNVINLNGFNYKPQLHVYNFSLWDHFGQWLDFPRDDPEPKTGVKPEFYRMHV